MILSDAADRARARLELGANVVVEAGAGTGKTTILTDRMLFLILAGGPGREGVPVSRIAAMTFTEKAAGELATRISARLSDLIDMIDGRLAEPRRRAWASERLAEAAERFGVPPEPARQRAARALEGLDRATIGTIHQFAALVLRLHPLAAGVDPQFAVDEGAAFDRSFDEDWSRWLDTELGASAPRREAWLEVLALAPLSDLRELALSLSSEGTRVGGLGATPAMAERLKAMAREVDALKAYPEPRGASKIRESAAAVCQRLSELAAALSGDRRPLPQQLALRELPARAWPKAWEGLPGREAYVSALAVARDTSAEHELLLRRAVALVAPFADRFRERYLRRGWISFDGLLARARAVLRDSADAREDLKARYDAVLIDEFQDTDPLQGELLMFLGERPGGRAVSWREVETAPGRLFVVGDPKQSIYRFRGADLRAYEAFTGALLRQGALSCALTTSFRSPEGIAGPVNAVFSRIMRPLEGLQPAYRPVTARPRTNEDPPARTARVILALVEGQDGDAAAAQDSQRAEASWIARWIAEQRRRKACELKDVAILLRATTVLGPVLAALKAAGLRYVVEAERFFYSAQEIVDFVSLLRALADPSDRLATAAVLRSALGGLDDSQLLELAERDSLNYLSKLSGLTAKTREGAAGIYGLLRDLRARAGREPLGDFVARVIRETFALELAAAAPHAEQTVANLLKFQRMAREAGEAGETLREFTAEVVASMRDSAEEGESPLAEASLDAVRVMTIHKAKGLEFPVVILPNLAAKRGGGGERPARRRDWAEGTAGFRLGGAGAADAAWALLDRSEKIREEHEAVRLLYVAMTRAKERLILLGRAGGAERTSLWALLQGSGLPLEDGGQGAAVLGGQSSSSPGEGGGAGWGGPVDVETVPLRAPALPARPGYGKAAGLKPKGFDAAWRRRVSERDRAEARLLFEAPTAYLQEWDKSPELEERRASSSAAARVGQICHAALERWDFSGVPDSEEATRRLSWTDPGQDWEAARAEAAEVLAVFAGSPAAAALRECEIVSREAPFVAAVADRASRGSIDILYRDKKGRLWVADYKTGREADDKKLRERYTPQARAYVRAVEQALGERPRFALVLLREGRLVEVPL